MDSRIFIRQANVLVDDINEFARNQGSLDHGQSLQKEIQSLFSGLGNPTLMAAENLLNAALNAGFSVQPSVQQRIRQAQVVWNNIP